MNIIAYGLFGLVASGLFLLGCCFDQLNRIRRALVKGNEIAETHNQQNVSVAEATITAAGLTLGENRELLNRIATTLEAQEGLKRKENKIDAAQVSFGPLLYVRVDRLPSGLKDQKVQMIKMWRAVTDRGLKQSKEEIEVLQDGHYLHTYLYQHQVDGLKRQGFVAVVQSERFVQGTI